MTDPAALLARAGLPAAPCARLSAGVMGEVWRAGAHVVKAQRRPPAGLYPAEAAGLEALAAAGVRAPAVRWRGEDGLIIDYLPPGPEAPEDLAAQLAALHRTAASAYGWPGPVFIGTFALPPAEQSRDGRRFWAEHRLRPLYAATRAALGSLAGPTERFIDRFDPPLEGPVLLHGDLWNGNVLSTPGGAALIDPSVWYGERAVDLAMMTLFGGFGPRFWAAYRRLHPIPPAVEAALPGYRLYYVLVHVHFFGAGYLDAVRRIVG